MTDNPMFWPIDVFQSTLSDLTRFQLERLGQWSKHDLQKRSEAEQIKRRLKSAGIPPLFTT